MLFFPLLLSVSCLSTLSLPERALLAWGGEDSLWSALQSSWWGEKKACGDDWRGWGKLAQAVKSSKMSKKKIHKWEKNFSVNFVICLHTRCCCLCLFLCFRCCCFFDNRKVIYAEIAELYLECILLTSLDLFFFGKSKCVALLTHDTSSQSSLSLSQNSYHRPDTELENETSSSI